MSSLLAFASATACVPPLMSWDMSTATTTPWKQNVKKDYKLQLLGYSASYNCSYIVVMANTLTV